MDERAQWTTSLWSGFGGALALGAVLLSGIAAPIERVVSDAMIRGAAAIHAPPLAVGMPDVAVVTLDPQSLRAIPEWPWPRSTYGRAVEALEGAGARSIGFDIDFSTPRNAAEEQSFAAVAQRSGRVVLAAFRQVQEVPGGGQIEVANIPVSALRDAAASLGSVLMPVDPDGVVRNAPRSTEIAGRARRTLAEASLDIATGKAAAEQVPSGRVAVDFRRAKPAVPMIPMIDVLEGRFDPQQVAGRVVLIGATAAEFQDLWATPLGPAKPGVWIQAILLRTLAAERVGAATLHPASTGAQALVLLALSIGAALLSGRAKQRRVLSLSLLFSVFAITDFALLSRHGWLLNPVLPGTALALQYAFGLESVRKRIGVRLHAHERSLTTLQEVGEAATAPASSDALSVALQLLGDVIDASAVSLMRADPARGLDERRVDWRRRGSGAIGKREHAAQALALRQNHNHPFELGMLHYVPLHSADGDVGVLVVERDSDSPLDEHGERTLKTVAMQLALSVDNLRLVERLRATFESSIEAIASAVEARDGYTESHCRRLAVFSTMMAHRLGLPDEEIEAIRLGALLHDVGKIGIRDAVLLKADSFTPEERHIMETHTVIGHQIAGAIHELSETTLACVRHHHERWDGSGYPDALLGESIPIGARIVAIVDVWDALSTARPYKKAFSQDEVLDILSKSRGEHFDPALVDLFFQILEEEGEEMLALIDSPQGASA